MARQNITEIQGLYETKFGELSEKFFKEEPWPSAETIGPLVKGDMEFINLYRELCNRHVHSKLKPTLDQRLEAYYNYLDIFDSILGWSTGPCCCALTSDRRTGTPGT
jgi:translation initiation factor 3 subunit L